MSLNTFPIVIDSVLYSKTWKDILYNELNDYIYGIGVYKDLTDSASLNRKIGRGERANAKYEELFYYKVLIDYIINFKEAATKSGVTDSNELFESYKFDKIRDNLLCRFNSAKLFDNLLMISNPANGGIDFMEIGCIIDNIGNELVINGDFASSSNWTEEDGTHYWVITSGTAFHPAGSGSVLFQSIGIQANKSYIVSFDITYFTTGAIGGVYLGNHGSTAVVPITGIGSYSETVITDSGITNDYVAIYAAGSGQITIDNVSVKEVTSADSCSSSDNSFIIE